MSDELLCRLKSLEVDGKVSIKDILSSDLVESFSVVSRLLFDDNGRINAKELVHAILSSSSNTPGDTKHDFLFDVYDTNHDGYICKDDLFKTLKIMVGDDLTTLQLMQLVDRTLRKFKDGKMNRDEFRQLATNLHVDHQLVVY